MSHLQDWVKTISHDPSVPGWTFYRDGRSLGPRVPTLRTAPGDNVLACLAVTRTRNPPLFCEVTETPMLLIPDCLSCLVRALLWFPLSASRKGAGPRVRKLKVGEGSNGHGGTDMQMPAQAGKPLSNNDKISVKLKFPWCQGLC